MREVRDAVAAILDTRTLADVVAAPAALADVTGITS
jgi:hypothetical protein